MNPDQNQPDLTQKIADWIGGLIVLFAGPQLLPTLAYIWELVREAEGYVEERIRDIYHHHLVVIMRELSLKVSWISLGLAIAAGVVASQAKDRCGEVVDKSIWMWLAYGSVPAFWFLKSQYWGFRDGAVKFVDFAEKARLTAQVILHHPIQAFMDDAQKAAVQQAREEELAPLLEKQFGPSDRDFGKHLYNGIGNPLASSLAILGLYFYLGTTTTIPWASLIMLPLLSFAAYLLAGVPYVVGLTLVHAGEEVGKFAARIVNTLWHTALSLPPVWTMQNVAGYFGTITGQVFTDARTAIDGFVAPQQLFHLMFGTAFIVSHIYGLLFVFCVAAGTGSWAFQEKAVGIDLVARQKAAMTATSKIGAALVVVRGVYSLINPLLGNPVDSIRHTILQGMNKSFMLGIWYHGLDEWGIAKQIVRLVVVYGLVAVAIFVALELLTGKAPAGLTPAGAWVRRTFGSVLALFAGCVIVGALFHTTVNEAWAAAPTCGLVAEPTPPPVEPLPPPPPVEQAPLPTPAFPSVLAASRTPRASRRHHPRTEMVAVVVEDCVPPSNAVPCTRILDEDHRATLRRLCGCR